MKKQDFSGWQCSVARTADLIGDWWTPLVLRDASRGVQTFDGFCDSLGISRNTLTQRLNRLVAEGLMRREAYNDRPKRYRYLLTEKGMDFVPVLLSMAAWGDKWLFDNAPPFRLRHKRCGAELRSVVTCACCGEEVVAADLEPVGTQECLPTLPDPKG